MHLFVLLEIIPSEDVLISIFKVKLNHKQYFRVDVCKTLAMNARQGSGLTYNGMADLYSQTARQGHLVFTKGFTPAFVRLGPQTVLTWIFLEQLRLRLGKKA